MLLPKNKIDNYEVWAQQKRREVKTAEANRHVAKINRLNTATKRCFEACSRRLDRGEKVNEKMMETMSSTNSRMNSIDEKISHIHQRLDLVIGLLQSRGVVEVNNNRLQEEETSRQREQQATRQNRERQLEEELTGQRNLEEVLRASARMPSMSTSLPKSFHQLIGVWARHGLSEFETVPKKNWTNHKIRLAYDKYLYLYKYVRRMNEESDGESIPDTVKRLDNERGRQTLATYYRLLKARDPNVRQRSSTNRAIRAITARNNRSNATHRRGGASVQQQRQQNQSQRPASENRRDEDQRRANMMELARQSGSEARTRVLHEMRRMPLEAATQQNNPQRPRRYVANAEGEIDGQPRRGRPRRPIADDDNNFALEYTELMGNDSETTGENSRTSGGAYRLNRNIV